MVQPPRRNPRVQRRDRVDQMAAGDRVLGAVNQRDRAWRVGQLGFPAGTVGAAVGDIVEQLVLQPVAAVGADDGPIGVEFRCGGLRILAENLAKAFAETLPVHQVHEQPAKGSGEQFLNRPCAMLRGEQAAVEKGAAQQFVRQPALALPREQFLPRADAIIMDEEMKILTQ